MSVAAILQARINKLPAMELRKWPRRNDAASIGARREAIRGVVGDEPLRHDDEAWTRAQESHTGVAAIPVAVVGPLVVELGDYELEEPAGSLRETGRRRDEVLVPLAHTEGGLSASMSRGMKAAATSGGFRTYVLHDRITRASCFICKDTEEAVRLANWIGDSLDDMRTFLGALDDPSLSKRAKLREVKTHVVGPMCHVLWAWTTGDACGPNMMTRNSYALNMGYVMQQAPVKPSRALLEANMGGDKKPSFEFFQSGHGKTVLAEATLDAETVRRVLRTTVDDLLELSWAGTHGAVASGMQSVAFTPASAIAAIFAATGQDLGMVGTSSMAHGVGRRVDGGLNVSIRLPGLEVATVGGGTTLPYARSWLRVLGCDGGGKVYRFAQIVAAATLALEISASAAMATAGSENFFRAHHERGGLR
jgi:hydroxymethylglutaryl-CoA reductase (NADPH)